MVWLDTMYWEQLTFLIPLIYYCLYCVLLRQDISCHVTLAVCVYAYLAATPVSVNSRGLRFIGVHDICKQAFTTRIHNIPVWKTISQNYTESWLSEKLKCINRWWNELQVSQFIILLRSCVVLWHSIKKMFVEYTRVADLAELPMALRLWFMLCFYSNRKLAGHLSGYTANVLF